MNMPQIKDKMIKSVSAAKITQSDTQQFVSKDTKEIVEKLAIKDDGLYYDDKKLQFENQMIRVKYGTELKDIPVGHVISYFGSDAPNHYLVCDGKKYSISIYNELAEHIKRVYGSYNYFGGDGITTFSVPNLSGAAIAGSEAIFCIKHSPTYFTTENMDSPYATDEEFNAAMAEILGGKK